MTANIWDIAHPQLRELIAYEPGRPIEEVARDMGLDPSDIVKLASNENPLGPSPVAIAAMQKAVSEVHLYPDGGGWDLRNAIADTFDLGMENVVLGNGSNEVIEFVFKAFLKPGKNIVVSDHAFVVYKLMATLFGGETIEVADPGFTHDLKGMADAITEDTVAVFITNPNNPTGTMVGQEEIDRFMSCVPEHVVVVFDEAYYEFLDTPPDTLKYVRENRNVVVLRTFSKIQGLAGTRIGYGLACKELAEVLQKTRQPFNANLVAQCGALAGLRDAAHQKKTKDLTDEGRTYFENLFKELSLEYVPSVANFILVNVGDGDAVFSELMKKGVIVRAMRGYKLPEWVRVSVGTMDENRRFAEALREVLAA